MWNKLFRTDPEDKGTHPGTFGMALGLPCHGQGAEEGPPKSHTNQHIATFHVWHKLSQPDYMKQALPMKVIQH